jgi:hypothetical protein
MRSVYIGGAMAIYRGALDSGCQEDCMTMTFALLPTYPGRSDIRRFDNHTKTMDIIKREKV